MNAGNLVEILIHADEPLCARDLIEASVHLPKRGSKYVAVYRGETGRRIWKTTGLRNRAAALAKARKWGYRRIIAMGTPLSLALYRSKGCDLTARKLASFCSSRVASRNCRYWKSESQKIL